MPPIVVKLEEGYRTAINIRTHTIITDEPEQDGGTNAGPTPMELMVGTLGACIAITTKAYANRKNWPLEGVTVELNMERIKREDYPAYTGESPYIHEFREKIHFAGPLSDEQKARLLQIAGKCPVHVTLEHPVFFVEELADEPLPQA